MPTPAVSLPEGLITMDELGVLGEREEGLNEESNEYKLADAVIRMTGVLIRHRAQQPDWGVDNIPHEIRVVALNFARRVFNNPQNQQRIQTGPIGESYSAEELVGLAFQDWEAELVEAYVSESGGLYVQPIGRSDALAGPPRADLAPLRGFGDGTVMAILPSLSDYLGIEKDG